MRKSYLFLAAAAALIASSDLALARHRVPCAELCPVKTYYFSWFTTYSEECPSDAETLQWQRMFSSKGLIHQTHKKPHIL